LIEDESEIGDAHGASPRAGAGAVAAGGRTSSRGGDSV
jgi:hypothetical protein